MFLSHSELTKENNNILQNGIIYIGKYEDYVGRDNVVGITTRYSSGGPGIESQ
jgi:hypothetical protein